ncbi:hypothetical protein FOXB_05157 [Fusarium oxysporum f. sp. conglutinans Fo5176]|uniref:Uncharacterized protein n=1 Tax=Fusarium oxysporum (strain Fo5176) TaxID=660025 RepID=F9FFH8_FUSOF|nr:hypothetical protein FOXB_05157 [Fusarium oxysporum f. sp. conglutinans Fo5176]
MSTTTSTSPTDIGQALINALNNPTGNLTRSLLLVDEDGNITGEKGSRFILQSYGYLGTCYFPSRVPSTNPVLSDLRVSLVASLTFPVDAPSFETLYPKASLQSLNSFDPLLYQATETAVLDFWNSCNDFTQYAVSSFSLADQFTGAGEVSLQGIISMLTSQEYSQPGSENDFEFKGLAQRASGMLLNLSQLANQKASSIQGLTASIASQASKVQTTRKEVDAVVKKFGLNSGDRYISTLDETLSMNQIVLNNSVEAAQAAKADWDREMMEANTAASYIWIPVAGWISGSNAILTKQKDVRMAWAEYQAHIGNKSTDATKTAYALVGAVNLLSLQNQAICDRVRSVGVALQEIQSTFVAIGNNLGQAATLMAAADDSVRTSLIANQQAIQAGITKAVQEFQDTLSAVQALIAIDSSIQTSGITADIDAPSVL